MDLAFKVQTMLQMPMLGQRAGKVAKFEQKEKRIVL